MNYDRLTAVAFSGHRTYLDQADEALRIQLEALCKRGFSVFLSGMAVGFDLAAAEAVLALRAEGREVKLIAAVPFKGQQERFTAADRVRYERILSEADETVVLSDHYYDGCFAVRNNFLVDHAAVLVAWYDGSPSGTRHAVMRARRQGLEIIHLHPQGDRLPGSEPTLF